VVKTQVKNNLPQKLIKNQMFGKGRKSKDVLVSVHAFKAYWWEWRHCSIHF
jgi:hypothetical protein